MFFPSFAKLMGISSFRCWTIVSDLLWRSRLLGHLTWVHCSRFARKASIIFRSLHHLTRDNRHLHVNPAKQVGSTLQTKSQGSMPVGYKVLDSWYRKPYKHFNVSITFQS